MSYITIKDISYIHPDREVLFRNISFSVTAGHKAAIVGNNGSGKSTLLRILAGFIKPAAGEMSLQGAVYHVPQHFGQYDGMTIAGALGMEKKLIALRAILAGDPSEENYAMLNDDWEVEERASTALDEWGLGKFSLGQAMSSLSGGEKTKVFLAGISLHTPGIILMDEPSNHLDAAGREKLYDLIDKSRSTILVVSHDRTLLNRLGTILELSSGGITVYGGNYEFYKERKKIAADALREDADEKEKALRKARQTARQVAERKQREGSRGGEKLKEQGVPRIMVNTIRNKAEGTAAKLKGVHTEKISTISGELGRLRQKLSGTGDIKVKFDDPGLHKGKVLVEAKDINFNYGSRNVWPEPLSFILSSGERVAISGRNGSGKTTLLKLVLGYAEPTAGNIQRGRFSHLYIDQEYSLIDNSLTVLQQIEKYNSRNLPDHILKSELHRFLFPKEVWEKPCATLSGGEKMKLIFCCLLVSDSSPALFVLDEPTNNLDIESLAVVTSSLCKYRGTLIVISHDRYFIEEIGITGELVLPSLE